MSKQLCFPEPSIDEFMKELGYSKCCICEKWVKNSKIKTEKFYKICKICAKRFKDIDIGMIWKNE